MKIYGPSVVTRNRPRRGGATPMYLRACTRPRARCVLPTDMWMCEDRRTFIVCGNSPPPHWVADKKTWRLEKNDHPKRSPVSRLWRLEINHAEFVRYVTFDSVVLCSTITTLGSRTTRIRRWTRAALFVAVARGRKTKNSTLQFLNVFPIRRAYKTLFHRFRIRHKFRKRYACYCTDKIV